MALSTFIILCFALVIVLSVIAPLLMKYIRKRVRVGTCVLYLEVVNGVIVIAWYLSVLAVIIATLWWTFR